MFFIPIDSVSKYLVQKPMITSGDEYEKKRSMSLCLPVKLFVVD